MPARIDDSVKLWQRPGPRRWLVFALVGALVALSCILLAGKEAQAKAKQSSGQEPVERATGESAKPAREAVGEATKAAGNKEEAGRREAGGETSRLRNRRREPTSQRR